MQIKSGNIAASPAYIYQVIGCIEYLGRNPNTDTTYGERKKYGSSGAFDPDKRVWAARVIDFMIGLKLVNVEDGSRRIVASKQAQNLYQFINKMDKEDIDYFLVDTSENPKLDTSHIIEVFKKNDINQDLYTELRNIFLDSYQFHFFAKYVYSHRFDSIEKNSFNNSFYSFVMRELGEQGFKKKGEKSETSSGATTANNQMPSLLEWLKAFNLIRESEGRIVFMKDVKELVKNRIENGGDHIIFTGAPGTGKTYSIIQYLKKNAKNRYKFVQFHSSFDYTDFVEGLRPALLDGTRSFLRMDGLFKEFCRYVVEQNIESIIERIKKEKPAKVLSDLNELLENKEYEKLYVLLSSDSDDLSAENKAIKEKLNDYLAALDQYYFFIDEINRADLSTVFGELLFALEESYKGLGYRFNTRYYALPTYRLDNDGNAELISDDCFKDGFFVPRNVRIIGTMNNIDRSVESIDFALRRRFDWIEIDANTVMEASLLDMGLPSDLVEKAKELNRVISDSEVGLNKDYHIGPAYYKGAKTNEDLASVYYKKIEPLLNEYVRGRDDEVIETFLSDCESALLGNSDGKPQY